MQWHLIINLKDNRSKKTNKPGPAKGVLQWMI